MHDGWIVENLTLALGTWNDRLQEIWTLLLMAPEDFRGGGVWQVILQINGALQSVGYALLVLFFAFGVLKEVASLEELRRPERAVRLLLRFVLAKAAIDFGMELMLALLRIAQGIIAEILAASGFGTPESTLLPDEIRTAVADLTVLESIPVWCVTVLGCIAVWVLAVILILTVYGRFFKIYLYAALAPIPLASFAGEPTQHIGLSFLRGYAAVCLEGAAIVLGCVIFSAFAASPPVLDPDAGAAALVWSWLGELLFNMLILVGTVRLADRVIKEMMGL